MFLRITRGTLPALPGISNFYLIKNFVKVHHTNETTLQTILMCRGIQNGTIHITTLSQGRKRLLANPDKSLVGIGKTVLSMGRRGKTMTRYIDMDHLLK